MSDYIDRNELLSQIEKRERLMVGDKTISIDALKDFIKKRPMADVSPVVHSFWDGDYCYECNRAVINEGYSLEGLYKYCPYCGAKME